jgi:hypothetical protein
MTLLAVTLVSGVAHGQRAAGAATGAELTPEEQRLARELATPAAQRFATRGPFYLVAIERLRDKAAEDADSTARFAVVTHYRYDGDVAIRSVVDLARRAVVRTDSAPHRPTPLASEELDQARRLALENAAVRAALGARADQVMVEALVLRTSSPRDPIYGHRVVRLLFRVGADYLREPMVLVDLHTSTVTIEPTEPAP